MTSIILNGIWATLYMTFVSTFLAFIIGLPLGAILVITDTEGLKPKKWLYTILSFVINLLRSVPFLILLITLIPITRALIGTSIGSTATIIPLIVGGAPMIAKMVENSLKEVERGKIEAAISIGATNKQIVIKVMLPEAASSLIRDGAISLVTILSYSAMAGVVGGGGLGDIAIRYGYYRYQHGVMLITVFILILLVQIFQFIGENISKKLDRRI